MRRRIRLATDKSLNIKILTDSRIRTLSADLFGGLPDDDSGEYHEITHDSGHKQWNTVTSAAFARYDGFDFRERCLKDVYPIKSTLTQTSNNTATNHIWIPSRGRFLIYIDKISQQNTRLHYQISETASSVATYAENSGYVNTLLICPRDEGISDNEPMTITIWRTKLNSLGAVKSTSEKLVIYCHTYAEPEIKITNPRNVQSNSPNAGDDYSPNYALWATEVINKQEDDSIDDIVFICPVLSLMTSQDGLDDSGLDSFTRISIKEYLGCEADSDVKADAFTGYFGNTLNSALSYGKVHNNSILADDNKAKCTCSWTGVFRDSDGSVVSLSGIANTGNEPGDNRLIWTPTGGSAEFLSDYSDHTYGRDENGKPIPDLRVCFRAGYKYLIRVRRFHGYAAGYANINDAGYPQYGYYSEEFNDYPPYFKSLSDSEGEVEVTSPNNMLRVITHAGPPINYNVMENNALSSYDASGNSLGTRIPQRWVGPYAGETIANGENSLFPGFSKSDYIIIDCVRTQTSSKNLVTVRPSSQEISADSWITFGYRHLQRTPTGIDCRWTRPISSVRLTNGRLNELGNRIKYFNRHGMMKHESDTDLYDETVYNKTLKYDAAGNLIDEVSVNTSDYLFNNTWEGTDTTARRIGKMYTALVSRIIEVVQSEGGWADTFRNTVIEMSKCDGHTSEDGEDTSYHYGESEETVKPVITIEINSPHQSAEGFTKLSRKFYEATLNNKSDRFDPLFTYDFLRYYSHFTAPTGHKPSIDDPATYAAHEGSWQIIHNEDQREYKAAYGNEYTWIPIINAQSGGNWLPVAVNSINSEYTHNPNKIVSDENYNVDNHFQGYYIEEESPHLGGCSYSKFIKPDNKHTFNMSDTHNANNSGDFTGESKANYNSTFAVIWENNVATGQDTAAAKMNRHFSVTAGGNEGYGGRQYFTTAPAANQRVAGFLYKRVPPCQDCENGAFETYTPRSIPCRADLAEPTVRTTHLGFYKTYISGEAKITLTYKYKKCEIEYDDEGNERCNKIEMPEPYIETKPLADLIENVGFTSGPVSRATQYNNNTGEPTNFTNSLVFNNVLTVFGEDNNGLGRCLSANDYTSVYHYYDTNLRDQSFKYINELEPYKTNGSGNGGGIEIPIRVRYTPIAQPVLTDYLYSGRNQRTTRNSNVIKLCTCYTSCSNRNIVVKEFKSPNIDDGMRYKEHFSIDIAYGLYNDKCRGYYKTSVNNAWYNKQHRLLTGAVGDPSPNTDFYPAVGICNAFLVVLFPSGATNRNGEIIDYFNQEPNWWSKRDNYQLSYSVNGSKPVIVADLAASDIYKSFSHSATTEKEKDTMLSSTLKCDFNYTDLVAGDAVITSTNDTDISKRNTACKLQENVWYDLVVVPIYTTRSGFGEYNYFDGAGTINGNAFGGGESNKPSNERITDFYGSNPLVIRKFLNIASISNWKGIIDSKGNQKSCGGGGGSTPSYSIVDPPFSTEGCILYPNVNHIKFNPVDGHIKECPGFWLNNTFRMIIRAPHYRKASDISRDPRYRRQRSYEQSLESASGGRIDNPAEFEFSDVMIHFGKFTDVVRVRNANGSFIDEIGSDGRPLTFNSSEFQELLNRNALDKEWLNARGVYTIRTNPEAWSKRVPEVVDDASNVRDTIKAGGLTSSDSNYKDRMVVFNPNIVQAYTFYPEGYYVQVRFLNARYASTSQQGTWSSWCGGVRDDDAEYDTQQDMQLDGVTSKSWKKDESLEYCVPVRSYSDIFTTKRNYIKASDPGSYLTTPNKSAKITVDYDKMFKDSDNHVKGSGSASPHHAELSNQIDARNTSDEAKYFKHDSVVSENHYIVPEYREIKYEYIADENDSTYQPWKPDNDYMNDFGYLKDPNIDSDKFAPSEESIKRHLAFHEMYYLDYIIRNMAKLYHSNWSEQCCEESDMNAKDIGWTLAKELISGYTKWSNEVSDATSSTRKREASANKAVADRFFKQCIKVEDFDDLLIVLKKLVDFPRKNKWSGNHTTKTDPVNSQGDHTGDSVLTIDSSLLSIDKCASEDNGGGVRMKIGSDISRPTQDCHETAIYKDWNYEWKSIEKNYIDQLWYLLKTYVIKESDIPTNS